MHHFVYRDGVLFAEGVDLTALAERVGTPFYCYSSATLERHYKVFADAFADVPALVCYALKANSNQAVIATLARLGAGADIVSGGELKRALAAGDLDGDGHQDLVALTATGETLVFLGNGKGSFTPEKTSPPAFPGACRAANVELADLDGDGRDEVVASFSDEHDQYGHCPSDGGLTAWKALPRASVPKR